MNKQGLPLGGVAPGIPGTMGVSMARALGSMDRLTACACACWQIAGQRRGRL